MNQFHSGRRYSGLGLIGAAFAGAVLSFLAYRPQPVQAQQTPVDARVQREQMIAELKQANVFLRQTNELLKEIRDRTGKEQKEDKR